MKRISTFDFTELEHYVDCLGQAGGAAERERYAGIISEVVDALPAASLPMAQTLVLACSRYAAWGGTFDHVRASFEQLAIWNAGALAARQLQAEAREDSAEHGRRGGRPPTGYDDEWRRLFDERKAKNGSLSDTETCKRIAALWTDEFGHGRGWRTILDGVRRAQVKT